MAITMKQLLEAGVHFGHQTARWNPKMAPYIYTSRNGIHIIDLQQTEKMANDCYNVMANHVATGGTVLFVGTKKQAQSVIKEEALRCGEFYIDQRWLGGILTNFKTIQSRIRRLKELERQEQDGTFDSFTKKEVALLKKEMEKLESSLGGIKEMKQLPGMIFIVDPKMEKLCVAEAKKLGIKTMGIVDTNSNPEDLDYIIPGNDDAIRSIKLIVESMAQAIIEAKQGNAGGEARAEMMEAAASATEDAMASEVTE
jgi:small subunit ribosomal protein S2